MEAVGASALEDAGLGSRDTTPEAHAAGTRPSSAHESRRSFAGREYTQVV
jgi:hypothetical protein